MLPFAVLMLAVHIALFVIDCLILVVYRILELYYNPPARGDFLVFFGRCVVCGVVWGGPSTVRVLAHASPDVPLCYKTLTPYKYEPLEL